MKRLFLLASLITISMQGTIFAQTFEITDAKKQMGPFDINPLLIHHRHFVFLKKDEKIIIELTDVSAYKLLQNIDSSLRSFYDNIAFYKDSINDADNVRIDYAVINSTDAQPYKEMRFKQYPPNGDIFIQRHGELAKLKLKQDTVRMIFHTPTGKPGDYIAAQVTFYLNNYTEIKNFLQNGMLQHIIDTLSIACLPKRYNPEKHKPSLISGYYTTISYDAYRDTTYPTFKKYNYLIPDESSLQSARKSGRSIFLNVDAGAGLVRNTFAPVADVYIEYNGNTRYSTNYEGITKSTYTLFRLSVSPYFFFNKDQQGNFLVSDNWFVNAEIGSNLPGIESKKPSFGIGYLFAQKGGYFKNTTMKIFTDVQVIDGLIISPELIGTNNFKQIFPGITLKVF